jgi:hypothetical protein
MSADANINGATCFNITAQNVTLDCKGYSITGNATPNTDAVYSNQLNSSIKNCIIKNFSTGVYLDIGTNNSTVYNNTISAVGTVAWGEFWYGCVGPAAIYPAYGIYVVSGVNNISDNRIINITGATVAGVLICDGRVSPHFHGGDVFGVYLVSSNSSTLQANNISSLLGGNATTGDPYIAPANPGGAAMAIRIGSSSNITIISNNISNISGGAGASAGNGGASTGVYTTSSSAISENNNSISILNGGPAGCGYFYGWFAGNGGDAQGIYFSISISSNFTLNIISNLTGGLADPGSAGCPGSNGSSYGSYFDSLSGGNLFYQNNITSKVWINNSNSSNSFNTTLSYGANIGNIYYFANGTASWNQSAGGFNISSSTAIPWADRGTSRPFNATPVGGNWSGLGSDWWPYTANVTGIMISACQNLSNASQSYTLNQSVSSNGTCFNVTAPNVQLACVWGAALTGNNSTNTYGVYSDQNNTTVKNCIITNFDDAIYFNGTTNGSISNVVANSTHSRGDTSGIGILLNESMNINILSVSANSLHSKAYSLWSSNNITLTTSTGVSEAEIALFLLGSSNDTIAGNYFSTRSTMSTDGTVYITSNSSFDIFANNTFTSTSASLNSARPVYADSFQNSIFSNNTLASISTSTPAFYLAATSGNNTFYENNITSPIWINDANGTNNYNYTTSYGANIGNIYYFANGTASWSSYGIICLFEVPCYADAGLDRPFNNTTVSGYWIGYGNDWYPYTNSTPAVNYAQNRTEVKLIYLTNSTGGIVNYPKFGYPYRCNALIFPRDNYTIRSATWTSIIVTGGANYSNQSATQLPDLQSWNSSVFTPSGYSGSIYCAMSAYGTDGVYSIVNRTFEVTEVIPGCVDSDICIVSAVQTYPGVSGNRKSRYLNLTINNGVTLSLSALGTTTLMADNIFNISGGIQSVGAAAINITSCTGFASGGITIDASTLLVSGTILSQGGAGAASCERASSSTRGGTASALVFNAVNMNLSGNIRQLAGASGDYIQGVANYDVSANGASAMGMNFAIKNTFFMSGGSINVTAASAPNSPNANSTCSRSVSSAAGIGGNAYGITLSGGRYIFSGGTVKSSAGNGGSGPANLGSSIDVCGGSGGDAYLIYTGASVKELTINGALFTAQAGTGGTYCEKRVDGHAFQGLSGVGGNMADSTYTISNITNVSSLVNISKGIAGPTTGGRSCCTTGCGPDSSTPQPNGTQGTNIVHYALGSNTTFNNFTKFQPGSATSDATPLPAPVGSFTFRTPSLGQLKIAAENVTVGWIMTNTSYQPVIYISNDNSTWIPIEDVFILYNGPDTVTPYSYVGETAGSTNKSVSTYIQDRLLYLKGAFQYNSMFTDYSYTYFNSSAIPTRINASRNPADQNVTASSLTFYCNYSRPDNAPVYNAPVQVNIDGGNHSAGFSVPLQNYTYTNTTPSAGLHNWTCIGWRPNYKNATSDIGNYTYGNLVIDLPPGVTYVRMFCPFPTTCPSAASCIGVTPWGQTAGIGIFKIRNLNATILMNVSVSVNQTIANVSMYARPNWTGIYTDIFTPTPSSTLLNTSQQYVQFNVNSTTPKYIWLHAICNNASAQTLNVTYNLTTQEG